MISATGPSPNPRQWRLWFSWKRKVWEEGIHRCWNGWTKYLKHHKKFGKVALIFLGEQLLLILLLRRTVWKYNLEVKAVNFFLIVAGVEDFIAQESEKASNAPSRVHLISRASFCNFFLQLPTVS